jgi:LysM repeat protein
MNRSTIVLITLLVLLGAIVYFLLPSSKEREREFSDKNPEINVVIDSASVMKLDMLRSGKSLTIENVGGKWTITAPGHFLADPSAVTQLLHGLSKFKIGTIISSNPEKQRLFQVDSSGTQVTATERNGKTVTLVVGKMGPSFSEVYVRLLGSVNVYLAEGIDTWSVTKDPKEWREKTILAIPSEAIKRVTYTAGTRQYEFKKDSSGWKSGDAVIESSVMNAPLTSFNNLRADDFVDSSITFQNMPVTVAIHGIDNVQMTLSPASPDSSKFFVQLSSSPQIFIVGKNTAEQILKPFESHQGQGKIVQVVSNIKKEAPANPTVVEKKVPVKQPPVPITSTKKTPEKISPAPDLSSAKNFPIKNAVPATDKKAPKQSPPTPAVTEKKVSTPSQGPDLSSAKKFPVKKAETSKAGLAKEPKNEPPLSNIIPEKKPEPIPEKINSSPLQQPVKQQATSPAKPSSANSEDEGELTVITVRSGETMQSLAKKYSVTVEQIIKWNLLKSINVKPGQELYIYVKK